MQITQNNAKETDPAAELENLVQDVAGYDCAYSDAKEKREAAEKALELAKAEEKFEGDKLRAILAAVRAKSATDAKVYDQHLRNCLGKMTTTRRDTWNSKTGRYENKPLAGVTTWSQLAKTGATDAQIISNLKIGFDSYSGVKSGLYQLKGLQFKSILGEDGMGREKGAPILDAKQLVAAIRRVMKIGNPKPNDPPPAKKPTTTTAKKPAAPTAKKAPEKKPAAAGAKVGLTAAQAKAKHRQTWGQWLSTLKGANAGNKELLADVDQDLSWWLDRYNEGKRPAEARTDWSIERMDKKFQEKLEATSAPPKKSKVKSSPTPPPATGEMKILAVKLAPKNGKKGEAVGDPVAVKELLEDEDDEDDEPLPSKLTNVRVISDENAPHNKHARKMQKVVAKVLDAREDEHNWMTFVEEVRRLSLGELELHEGPVRPELWKFFQDEYNAGAKPVQAVERWHEREMDEAKKKTQPAPADSTAWNAFMDRVHELNGKHTIIQLGNTACWNFFINEWQRGMMPELALNAWNAQHGKSESAPTTSLSNGSLRMPLFDSSKPPEQLEQKLSWEQWAHQVRTCKAAKTCGDWPQSGSLMNRQPLVDPDDRMVRAAYEAGRKPAAAAAELAQMFTKRASRADRSRSTLSDAEEKSLRGQKVGAA